MSTQKLCSLPWCRKPIESARQYKNFPSDRPTQLAWLDALDAGAWFSIPQETLSTGLLLCSAHFDKRGEIRRRYDVPSLPPSSSPSPPPFIKPEPEDISSNDDDDDLEGDPSFGNEPRPPPKALRRSSKRISPSKIKVSIIQRKKLSKATLSNSDRESTFEDFGSSQSTSTSRQTLLDSIDSDKLLRFTNDAINTAVKVNSKPKQRKSLNLIQKMEIIRLFDSGLKQSQIGRKLNLRKSTVWTTIARRDQIEEAYKVGTPLRKKLRKCVHDDVNQALYAWYQRAKSQDLFVNTRVLVAMAENIASELGRTEFKGTAGWLEKFKNMYQIRFGAAPAKPRKKILPKPNQSSEVEVLPETETKAVEPNCSSVFPDDGDNGNEELTNQGEDQSLSDLNASLDIQNHFYKVREWAMSRKQCPDEVYKAFRTLETFIQGNMDSTS